MSQRLARLTLIARVFWLLAALLAALVAVPVAASGGGIFAHGIGARALGMGDAFVAVADDETAVYWNPAGITQIGHFSLVPALAFGTDNWAELWQAVNSASAGQSPVLTGSQLAPAALVGVVTSRFAVSELISAGATADVPGDGTASLNGGGEAATIVTGAVPFQIANMKQGTVAVGVNVKFVQTYGGSITYNLSTGAITDNTLSGSGIGFDAGLLARLGDFVQIGAMARDVYANVPGHALRLDGGVAAKVPFFGTRVAASIQDYTPGDSAFSVHVGAEQVLLGLLAARAGAYWESGGLGSLWYTAGAGIALGPLVIDLGVASDDMLVSHARASLSAGLRF